ncbi:hypothetical protein BDN72DRAFT_863062 [Pluteus cervinus]|uniref:Uncharacterized protein n=1 Tax=Pluteus cervinus TaxID=181527 RepID=A0ACD3A9Z5_9AGAR|nr:hypothetical protein BDN72DRAFT_863062 [Pluteus cervinus]
MPRRSNSQAKTRIIDRDLFGPWPRSLQRGDNLVRLHQLLKEKVPQPDITKHSCVKNKHAIVEGSLRISTTKKRFGRWSFMCNTCKPLPNQLGARRVFLNRLVSLRQVNNNEEIRKLRKYARLHEELKAPYSAADVPESGLYPPLASDSTSDLDNTTTQDLSLEDLTKLEEEELFVPTETDPDVTTCTPGVTVIMTFRGLDRVGQDVCVRVKIPTNKFGCLQLTQWRTFLGRHGVVLDGNQLEIWSHDVRGWLGTCWSQPLFPDGENTLAFRYFPVGEPYRGPGMSE